MARDSGTDVGPTRESRANKMIGSFDDFVVDEPPDEVETTDDE